MSKNLKQSQDVRKKPTLSHDSFFKLIFSDPRMVKELLELVLSQAEMRAYNLDDIRLEKDSHKKKLACAFFFFKKIPS